VICPRCAGELEEGVRACPECGAALAADAAAPAEPPSTLRVFGGLGCVLGGVVLLFLALALLFGVIAGGLLG
jgi:hypothetical protein